MAASFPTTVKTWTPVEDSVDTVLAEHMNEAYDEIIAIETELLDPTIQAWQTPSYQNSWVDFGSTYETGGYYKDPFGVVHIKGLVKSGSAATMFTLPSGYRPAANENFAMVSYGSFGYISILSDGQVQAIVKDNRWVSLSGITFRAA